ncbi:hypothetical protein GCM10011332_22590 [Terasakiella brassicae]|uniref:Uncharacterized protein n=1 Tax=Terasakiella brassicae TaxID=1634917 RepID=A0A917C429_9PROT|nr:hypothetical protein GCM10011332_22590 [Terasakiella brassicae]
MLFVLVHGGDVQDRDGAPDVFRAVRYRFLWLRHVFQKAAMMVKNYALTRLKALKSYTALGGGTHLRMAQSLSAVGERLGEIN